MKAVVQNTLSGIKNTVVDDLINGDAQSRGELFGRATIEVIGAVVGAIEAKAAVEGGKVVKGLDNTIDVLNDTKKTAKKVTSAAGDRSGKAVRTSHKIMDKADAIVDVVEKAKEVVGERSGINFIDDIALKHSSEGDFTYNPKTGHASRMKGGGYGQSNINFLEEHGINYNIVKEYNNGVRVGNIPKHKTPSKRTGTGQAWFPENWSDSKIKEAGIFVANLLENKNLPDGVIGYGYYDGVRVGIIKTNGKVGTIFPDADFQP